MGAPFLDAHPWSTAMHLSSITLDGEAQVSQALNRQISHSWLLVGVLALSTLLWVDLQWTLQWAAHSMVWYARHSSAWLYAFLQPSFILLPKLHSILQPHWSSQGSTKGHYALVSTTVLFRFWNTLEIFPRHNHCNRWAEKCDAPTQDSCTNGFGPLMQWGNWWVS